MPWAGVTQVQARSLGLASWQGLGRMPTWQASPTKSEALKCSEPMPVERMSSRSIGMHMLAGGAGACTAACSSSGWDMMLSRGCPRRLPESTTTRAPGVGSVAVASCLLPRQQFAPRATVALALGAAAAGTQRSDLSSRRAAVRGASGAASGASADTVGSAATAIATTPAAIAGMIAIMGAGATSTNTTIGVTKLRCGWSVA